MKGGGPENTFESSIDNRRPPKWRGKLLDYRLGRGCHAERSVMVK